MIDTELSRARASLLELSRRYHTANLVGDGLVLIPSRQAVADLAARHGFATVALEPNVTDFAGMSDYRRQRRGAFISSRTLDLGGLPAWRVARAPWWLRDPRALTSV